MELRRKQQRPVGIGDYCVLRRAAFVREATNNKRVGTYDLEVLDVDKFIAVNSVFGLGDGDIMAFMPVKTITTDYHAKSLIKFLKKERVFYIHKKYIYPISVEDEEDEIFKYLSTSATIDAKRRIADILSFSLNRMKSEYNEAENTYEITPKVSEFQLRRHDS